MTDPGAAPASPFADPAALFAAAVDALGAEQWLAVARLCDPVSLRAFHRQLIERHAPSAPPREITVEDYLKSEPDMPREVAEYQVAQFGSPTVRGDCSPMIPSVGSDGHRSSGSRGLTTRALPTYKVADGKPGFLTSPS